MCARYGIERRSGFAQQLGLGGTATATLEAWITETGGVAQITGARAFNLNPVITAPDGELQCDLAWWWLHVEGRPAPFSAFNSRAERLTGSWRQAFQHRGLLPASWYVEKGVRFGLAGGEPFTLAAITAASIADDGQPLLSYSLVTREAVGAAGEVHLRMPLIVAEHERDLWLDPRVTGDRALRDRVVAASDTCSAAVKDLDRPPRLF